MIILQKILYIIFNKVKEILIFPLFYFDDVSSRIWLKKKYSFYQDVERAIVHTKQQGFRFAEYFFSHYFLRYSGWALSKSSIRYFCGEVFSGREKPIIVEFGGGASTIFWNNFSMEFSLHSYEHDFVWFKKLNSYISNNQKITLIFSSLRQFSDTEKITLFQKCTLPSLSCNNYTDNKDTSAKNLFYNIRPNDFPLQKIDALVLDGPHGNGRSMAFPLFRDYLKPGSIVLIDDFNHYPFLDDLSKVFEYKVIKEFKSPFKRKSWTLLRLV